MKEAAKTFAALLQEGAIKENIDTLFMGMKEAEAVKLLSLIHISQSNTRVYQRRKGHERFI